jgi:hypothetical protein
MSNEADRDLLRFAEELKIWVDYYQPEMYVDIRPSLRSIADRALYAAKTRKSK